MKNYTVRFLLFLGFFFLQNFAHAESQGGFQQPSAFGSYGGFGGGGAWGAGGGFGGGGAWGAGGGFGGGMGRANSSGKEAMKSIEAFGTKTVGSINKAGENFSKSLAESSKNNLDFSKLTPDLNSQISDGLRQVNEEVRKINEQFKANEDRKPIGVAIVDQNVEAITANAKAQTEINAAIASRYTFRAAPSPSSSAFVNNLQRISGAGSSRNSNPLAGAMGAEPKTPSSDPNHRQARGFTRRLPYNSPFASSFHQ